MSAMKILLVEDAIDQQLIFKDVVDIFNEKHDLTVESDIAEDTYSALEKINNSYDGAIIDMRLNNNNEGGNEIVRRFHDLSINVPVIFVTAYPDLIEENPLIIKKRSRDADTYESDLLFFQEKYKAGFTPKEATQTYTALIQQSEGWWIGWIQEVRGVTCQERTKSELLDTLKITLREALEFYTLGTSRPTEIESEEVKTSDIEFSAQESSHQTEIGLEEIEIVI